MSLSLLGKKINIRQMQAYAALCLWQFCENWEIKHESINDLVLHLLMIMTAQDLSQWERRGAALHLTGRGDPIPADVIDNIPPNILDNFNGLVEICVEIGIVDMYGASTEQPLNFFNRCIDIIRDSNIELPCPELIIKYGRGADEWGKAINNNELNDIFKQYNINMNQ